MQRQPASALDLFTDSTRMMGDSTIVSVMVFDRHLDLGRLRVAVERCFGAYPILRARLVRGNGPAYWELLPLTAGMTDVPVTDIGTDDHRRYVTRGVDPYTAPQAVFRVFRSPARDVLVINLAHAAADGGGMKELARTLLQAYLDPGSVPSNGDGLPARDTLWTATRLDGQDTRRTDGVTLINPMWPSPCAPSKAPSDYHRAVIAPEGLSSIKKMAKASGGTVNDVFLAAYFLALSDLTGHNGPQSVFFPVDLRRYLTDGSRGMTNQSANVSITVYRDPGEGMAEMLARISEETGKMKRSDIGIMDQVMFDRGSDPEGLEVRKMVEEMVRLQNDEGLADIFITNPGPMVLPEVPGLEDAYICYPGVLMPATCFVISTFKGSVTVTIGYQDDERSRDATLRALKGFLKHLPLTAEQFTVH